MKFGTTRPATTAAVISSSVALSGFPGSPRLPGIRRLTPATGSIWRGPAVDPLTRRLGKQGFLGDTQI